MKLQLKAVINSELFLDVSEPNLSGAFGIECDKKRRECERAD